MNFSIRDDDTSYWTSVEELDRIYNGLFRKGFKVSFSVIPYAYKAINRGNRAALYFSKDQEYGCTLTLLDPKSGDYDIIARENDWILTAVPFENQFLYAGEFTKGSKQGCALTLHDSKSCYYKVLARENNWINTAVTFENKILYAGGFTKDGKDGCALTLLDPESKNYEILARENDWILTVVPFKNQFSIFPPSHKPARQLDSPAASILFCQLQYPFIVLLCQISLAAADSC